MRGPRGVARVGIGVVDETQRGSSSFTPPPITRWPASQLAVAAVLAESAGALAVTAL
jgi:hypothetical protein